MKSNASLLYSLILIIGDFLALVAAFVIAFIVRGHFSNIPVAHPIPANTYLAVFLALLPFWILIFALLGLYNNSIQEKRFNELGRLFIGSFIGLLFVISYGYAVNRVIFPARLVPVYGFGLAFIFLVSFRNIAREARIYLYRYGIGITRVLIVGNTKISEELVDSLGNYKESGYEIVGVVGGSNIKHKYRNVPVFSSFDEAVSRLLANDINSIVQTELFAAQQTNSRILEYSQTNHIAYRFVPGNSELFVGNISVELFRSSMPVIAVHQTALIGWGRIVKRLSDVIIGGLALVISLPIMLIICFLFVFDHGDPFFSQTRLSRFGSKIRIYKFRTQLHAYHRMTPEEGFKKMGKPELAKQFRANGDFLENDPRISRLGRFLRRTSLDELPQLINIVRGDISLVGPRALQPFELEQYDKKDLILAVKSGLTGLAQVSGRRDISFEERRKLDLYYVQNWSIWLDLVIIVKTIRVVLGRIGAK